MSRCHERKFSALSVLGLSAVLAAAACAVNVAQAQPPGNQGAAAGQAQRPAISIGNRIPQQATDRIPQHARDRAPPLGGTLPTQSQQDGLTTASEVAADEAKAVAPPLGGTLPEQSEQDGLTTALEVAADEAKAVAPALGGDPENARPEEEPAE